MEFKWVHSHDLDGARDVARSLGWSEWPDNALGYVAYDDRGIAGFNILQLRPHPEPLYVRPDMVGTGLSLELATGMEHFLASTGTKGFIVIADTPEAKKMCEKFGMKLLTSPVYVR